MSLVEYEKRLSNLNLNRSSGHSSPHKIALLLSIMDLVESGELPENRIEFNQILIDAFSRRFNELRSNSDRNNPHLPFFHLQSEGFWHIQVKPGKTESWGSLKTASSAGTIREHVEYAFLDDELFELIRNPAVNKLFRLALQSNFIITESVRLESLAVSGWNWIECEACVSDYFDMLFKELHDIPYNKTAHRKLLSAKLTGRNESSIEFKHQNISAILIEIGLPYISGYKPRFNYQSQLKEVVITHLAANQASIEQLAPIALTAPPPYESNWDEVFDPDTPEIIPTITTPKQKFIGRIQNYAQREANNRSLGEFGEQFVIEYEKYRLKKAGRNDLAREVEWSSKTRGDGLGFDVRSFSIDNKTSTFEEHFIEVKTTNSGKYQPFYVTENELAFSKQSSGSYSLFRVYDFKKRPRLFLLPGAIDQNVNLQPQLYSASFRSSVQN